MPRKGPNGRVQGKCRQYDPKAHTEKREIIDCQLINRACIEFFRERGTLSNGELMTGNYFRGKKKPKPQDDEPQEPQE